MPPEAEAATFFLPHLGSREVRGGVCLNRWLYLIGLPKATTASFSFLGFGSKPLAGKVSEGHFSQSCCVGKGIGKAGGTGTFPGNLVPYRHIPASIVGLVASPFLRVAFASLFFRQGGRLYPNPRHRGPRGKWSDRVMSIIKETTVAILFSTLKNKPRLNDMGLISQEMCAGSGL